MPISASLAGVAIGARDTVLTTRRMLAFAAGIGDTSGSTFDDLHPAFMAHPALCVSLEWPLVSDAENAARLVPDPRERFSAVHFVQDSHFHRPMRSGERLRTSGSVTGVWRGKQGARLATALHTHDSEGQQVVTSHMVAVYRGVDVEGEDRPPQAPAVPARDGRESAVRAVEIAIDACMPHRYTECAGIWNPIHTERRVARAAGLPDIILHGTATWALAGTEILRQLGNSDASRLKRLHGRFGAMVAPGSRVLLQTCYRTQGAQTEVFFEVHNAEGQLAVSEGYALLDGVPSPP